MAIVMRDAGFAADDWNGRIAPLQEAQGDDVIGIDLDPGEDLAALSPHLGQIALIRVRFGAFSDGRGFTVARRLRAMGFTGRLRAAGPILADQYAMARRAGFDEVEVDPKIAARQPEAQWLARADWRAGDHQARLRG
ncbi:DUF934 domain-containing protein [Roseicyclus marinus]|uniref:DUF934 domain-containing protein n=1 Tax=Roseicyclus marinus TaxID=2161673 RepID=UPI00240F059E|nr:DUF934 domain-containing protein [Roseicyclus marinus]MDG3040370.1 DUF934 domain-containing protein [Roseicyclus marinus]